jgi:hypothetical protein
MTCGVPPLFSIHVSLQHVPPIFSIAKIEALLFRHRFHTDKEDKEKIVSLVD